MRVMQPFQHEQVHTGPDVVALSSATPLSSGKIPTPQDLSSLSSVREQNAAITEWYHEVDRVMTAYLGTPELPSWARFAKWASYNAGEQLRNIEEGVQVFRAMDAAGLCVREVAWTGRPKAALQAVKALFTFTREVFDLFKHDGLVGEAVMFALSESGMSDRDRELMAGNIGRHCPRSLLVQAYLIAKHMPRMLRNLGTIAASIEVMHQQLSTANRAIYEFMAPRLTAFLVEGAVKQSGEDHTERFFTCALNLYAQARDAGLKAQQLAPLSVERSELLERRRTMVAEANLFATFGEQLYRAQPHFDKISDFLRRSTRFLRLHFPGTRLTFGASITPRNWAAVYDRMGVDLEKAPQDPDQVSPEKSFPLCRRDSPRFLGTIGHLLTLGLESPDLADALKAKPPMLEPAHPHIL